MVHVYCNTILYVPYYVIPSYFVSKYKKEDYVNYTLYSQYVEPSIITVLTGFRRST